MPKENYPALNAKQVVKLLKRAGYTFVRQNGSHAIYEKEIDGKIFPVVVPIHAKKDLKPGTLNSIISQSGMTKKQFYSYLSVVSMILTGMMKMIFFWDN